MDTMDTTDKPIETVAPPKTFEEKPTPPLDKTPKFEPTHTFKLRAKVTLPNDGGSFTEVTLRAPNGLDCFECDRPTNMIWITNPDNPTGPPAMRQVRDYAAIRKWLPRLSDKPIQVFYAMAAGDFNTIVRWLEDEVAAAGN